MVKLKLFFLGVILVFASLLVLQFNIIPKVKAQTQIWEILEVDSFDWVNDDWTEVGTDPYLNASDGTTNMIWENFLSNQEGWFHYENLTETGEIESIDEVIYYVEWRIQGAGTYFDMEQNGNADGVSPWFISINHRVDEFTWTVDSFDLGANLTTRTHVDTFRVNYEPVGKSGGTHNVEITYSYINVTYTASYSDLHIQGYDQNAENITVPYGIVGIGIYNTPHTHVELEHENYTIVMRERRDLNKTHYAVFVRWNDTGSTNNTRVIDHDSEGTYTAIYTVYRGTDLSDTIIFGIGVVGLGLMFLSWVIARDYWKQGEYANAVGYWMALFFIGVGLFTVLLGG